MTAGHPTAVPRELTTAGKVVAWLARRTESEKLYLRWLLEEGCALPRALQADQYLAALDLIFDEEPIVQVAHQLNVTSKRVADMVLLARDRMNEAAEELVARQQLLRGVDPSHATALGASLEPFTAPVVFDRETQAVMMRRSVRKAVGGLRERYPRLVHELALSLAAEAVDLAGGKHD